MSIDIARITLAAPAIMVSPTSSKVDLAQDQRRLRSCTIVLLDFQLMTFLDELLIFISTIDHKFAAVHCYAVLGSWDINHVECFELAS